VILLDQCRSRKTNRHRVNQQRTGCGSEFISTKIGSNCNMDQWRNNRACKACSARGPSAVGGPKFSRRCFLKVFFGKEGALLEYLHAGPLQPCYATDMDHYKNFDWLTDNSTYSWTEKMATWFRQWRLPSPPCSSSVQKLPAAGSIFLLHTECRWTAERPQLLKYYTNIVQSVKLNCSTSDNWI